MTQLPQNVEVAITRLRNLADSAMDNRLYERECKEQMRNAIVLLGDAYAEIDRLRAALHSPHDGRTAT